MPIITVTMRAEVGDLESFYPDKPKGITIENVAGVLQNLVVDHAVVMVKLASQEIRLRKKHGDAGYDHSFQCGKDDHEIAKRLLDSLEITQQ